LYLRAAGTHTSVIDPPRYEPLPGLAELPAWAWRRAGRGVRIGAGIVLLAALAMAVVMVPALRSAAREQDDALQHARAEQRAELVRRLEAEQRPVRGRSRAVDRAAMMDELTAAIETDARTRVRRGELDGPIRRAECEPFPRTVDGIGADRDPTRRRGRYSCLAITADFTGGVIGHQYRALIDFQTGRYAFCKITGQSGPSRDQLVTTPRVCGG
jgi:hypothetical protein